jgi:hypothetical protein
VEGYNLPIIYNWRWLSITTEICSTSCLSRSTTLRRIGRQKKAIDLHLPTVAPIGGTARTYTIRRRSPSSRLECTSLWRHTSVSILNAIT